VDSFCGGSGIYQTGTAVVPTYDEYAFDLTLDSIRRAAHSGYGLEHTITSATSATFIDCAFTANTLSGAYVCLSNLVFVGTIFLQNSNPHQFPERKLVGGSILDSISSIRRAFF
jgi:hypothetical protein